MPITPQPNQILTATAPPVINTYSINVTAPVADHGRISAIYEDVLPGNIGNRNPNFFNTSSTIGERLNILNFIRGSLLKYADGEDINIDGTADNSLLSYLKFMELNPYAESWDNPYKSLPDGLLIYRSCYPIKYDAKTAAITCARYSIGINIRIYKLSWAEYNIKKLQTDEYYNYSVWRELIYYEFIREKIIKQKICPNFVLLYLYYICENPNINFDKLSRLKNNKVNPYSVTYETTNNIKYAVYQNNNSAYSGRALICLTEAPIYNLSGWASRTYKTDGRIKRMVNTGYHKSEVWFSILFQLIAALYTLQKFKIIFHGFSPKNNIYIKDISAHENITNYWKYKIDGIDYYIPNYGYLLLIDSDYHDIQPCGLIKPANSNLYQKIYSNIFEGPVLYSDASLLKSSFDIFKSVFNTNEFSKSYTVYGGTKPPEDIISLITAINTEANNSNNQNINYYIPKFFGRLLNNRIGTLLSENEIKNIRFDDHTEFNPGQIVVQEIRFGTYKFVIFLKRANPPGAGAIILTKSDTNKSDTLEQNIGYDLLSNYSKYENIQQNFKPAEASLNEDDLLEIYII